MDRLADRLAQKVPQRHVDRADGAHATGALLLPQIDDERFAMQRIPAHQHGLEMRDQPLPVGGRRIRRRAEKGVALDAVVGGDAQQPERARAGEPAVLAVLRRRDVVPGEQRERDVGDLHGVVSRFAPLGDQYRLAPCPTKPELNLPRPASCAPASTSPTSCWSPAAVRNPNRSASHPTWPRRSPPRSACRSPTCPSSRRASSPTRRARTCGTSA